ncbi:MAG: pyroglutamyl-peptidase I [Anaerolineaceae bacterium]|nr:pyroglutamyl-peptidase I [Anaerolineaceae bacterium]
MKVLITGFEPFGKSPINPSQILVNDAPVQFPGGIELVKAILPVEKKAGPEALLDAVLRHQPEAVICFGLATGRSSISLERVAINLMDYRIPDNAGQTVEDQPVIADGPAAYFSSLPLRAMFTNLQSNHIPVELSLTAGAYLCNQVFYTLMHHLVTHQQAIPAGFIHLPACPKQADHFEKPTPTLSLAMIKSALPLLLESLT